MGVKPEEAGKAHQEDQVEIGIPLAALVQPDDGVAQVGEQRTVLRLLAHGTAEELGEEKGDCRLARVVGERGERVERLRLLYLIYRGVGTEVRLQFHQRQGLEQHRLHCRIAVRLIVV